MAFSVKHRETASPSSLSAVKYAATGFGRLSDFIACFIFVSFLLGVICCALSNCGDVSAINDVFAPGNRRRAARSEERNQLRYFFRTVWAPERNPAERIH